MTAYLPFKVPAPPFAGLLEAKIRLTDASGAEIACIDFSVQLA